MDMTLQCAIILVISCRDVCAGVCTDLKWEEALSYINPFVSPFLFSYVGKRLLEGSRIKALQ